MDKGDYRTGRGYGVLEDLGMPSVATNKKTHKQSPKYLGHSRNSRGIILVLSFIETILIIY